MDANEHDVLAYLAFRASITKLHSMNSIERLNKEVKRRAEVVGIFPNEVSIMRLIMIPSHLGDYTTMTDATKQ